MDLKRKLARLGGVGPGGKPAPPPPPEPPPAPAVPAPVVAAPAEPSAAPSADQAARVAMLRRMMGELAERHGTAPRRGPPPPRPGPLSAEPRTTPHGVIHVAERLCAPGQHHGSAPLAEALDAEASLVASLALQPDLAGVDFQRMLFLDTETTGLAGGTGTVPFLVGLAWFEGRSLRVHQLFLRRLGEEAPLLRELAARMAQASCLVTFNGKSFDWPLLRTRFVLNRVPVPPVLPHLDLLHCARRVFKHRGSGARLVHLEEQVLGFHRVDDVDGALIPELYFRFLRGGDGSALTPVLEHNVNDLLLLAALLGLLARRFRASGAEGDDPRDLLGFAGVALRARDPERALAFAQAAAAGDSGAVRTEALALASRLSHRGGDARTAAANLQRALTTARVDQAPPLHLSLAKLYEHGLKDLPRALHHARLCRPAEDAEALSRRVERLERKLSRRSAREPLLELGVLSPARARAPAPAPAPPGPVAPGPHPRG